MVSICALNSVFFSFNKVCQRLIYLLYNAGILSQDVLCPHRIFSVLFSQGATFPSTPALWFPGSSANRRYKRERKKGASPFPPNSFSLLPHFMQPPGCDSIPAGSASFHGLLTTSPFALPTQGMLTAACCSYSLGCPTSPFGS